jgi:hypothetical protein
VNEYQKDLVRACLAALARRTGAGLVVSLAEIEAEYEHLGQLGILVDGDAKCVRIAVYGEISGTEVRA